MSDTKEAILTALDRWVRQRPGLEFGNYGNVSAYRAELRGITRDLHHARELLAYAGRSRHVTAGRLEGELLSGRLTWDGAALHYTTGQYWPTEYRAAACRALASAIWYAWANEYRELHGNSEGGADAIRRKARQEFSRGVAREWFR